MEISSPQYGQSKECSTFKRYSNWERSDNPAGGHHPCGDVRLRVYLEIKTNRGIAMKAIVFDQHGGPEVLQCREVPTPVIAANEVLVRVRACALNHLDLWVRRGLPGIRFQFPHIPGSDIAGEISEVGNLISDVRVGECVMLAPGLSCGHCQACAAGADNRCRKYTLFGYLADGGCAEYVKSPAANIIPIPSTMKFEAAAIPVVFLTA